MGEVLEPHDDRDREFLRQVAADGEGRFRFDRLPIGEYYVWCAIQWQWKPEGIFARWHTSTVLVGQRVKLEAERRTVDVVLPVLRGWND